MSVQRIEVSNLTPDERVETGPVQFFYQGREDWPGYFIRGDNAAALRLALAAYIVNPSDVMAKATIRAYIQEFDGCNVLEIMKQSTEKGAKNG